VQDDQVYVHVDRELAGFLLSRRELGGGGLWVLRVEKCRRDDQEDEHRERVDAVA
jgi:hypothetical protein